MESPLRIFFVGNSPQGGKLRAHFSGTNLPSSIQIKGTTDNQPVKLRKNGKGVVTAMWTSKKPYPNRVQVLQLISCGKIVQECKYDGCGDVVIDNPKATINTNTSKITTNAAGAVNFVWTSIQEDGVDQYCSEKRLTGTTGEWDAFEADEPTGAGSIYTSIDQPTASANIDYRLRAIYTDGTDTVLMAQSLNVVVPTTKSASIQGFAGVYNENTGNVDLSWTVTAESSVIRYKINRKDPGSSTYQLAASAPNGVGPQQIPNFVGDSGDYSYQILPVFVGEVDGDVLATISVTVPVLA